MKFKIIEHTADIGLQVFGGTLAGLFENAATGMLSIMLDGVDGVRPKKTYRIKTEGVDYESLLINFLNELVYRFSADKFLFILFRVKRMGEKAGKYFMSAEASGEKIDPAKHKLNFEIKAATYHDIKIKRRKDGSYTTKIIFDV
ncbi:MAG: archease [Elusimicrobia bacterium]|nr:archease [Elusimicrobiota bacterium]